MENNIHDQIKEFERELKLKENHLEQVIKSKEVQIETEVNKRTKNEFQKDYHWCS